MEELLENARESFESAEDDLLKKRYNSAVASFFRAIANMCDYLIYLDMKIISKNHNERFNLLKKYFPEIYGKVFALFGKYRDSYNLRLSEKDAGEVKKYAIELEEFIRNKKKI